MLEINARLRPLLLLGATALAACGGSASTSSPELAASRTDAVTAAASLASAPSLGTAGSFAILAGPAVTCTDATLNGDVGIVSPVPPGSSVTRTNCVINGAVHAGDPAAAQAGRDFATAYAAFQALPCDQTFPTATMGNQTLTPGVYCFPAALTSTGGVLTLDGPSNGLWIFKIGTLGTGALTGTGFSVVTPNGGPPPCNSVYWWVADAVTLTDSKFVGTILAGAAVTITRGTYSGDALAKAAVTITGAVATACELGSGGGGGGGNPPPQCKDKDFVTGGGWIRTPSRAKGTFGVAAGIKHGAPRGHLTYEDHGWNGPKVKSTGVTAYIALDARSRRIEGTAKVNGHRGYTYQVDVTDNGEPGRDDTFSIRVTAKGYSYKASGSLDGGNIALHKGHRASCDGHGDGDDDDDDDDSCNDDGHDGEDDDHGHGDDHGR